jgi:uncharacterized membrane protein (UPF0127 family)
MSLLIRSPFARMLASLLLGLLAGTTAAQEGPQLNLPRVQLQAGMHIIDAQVATGASVYTGLMYRREMPQHEGMLFAYDTLAVHCFYMRNTFLPLSIAFIADDGTIVNIRDMQPQTLDSHCADKPVRYALEMHQGWFAKRGIKPGFKLAGPGGKPFGSP